MIVDPSGAVYGNTPNVIYEIEPGGNYMLQAGLQDGRRRDVCAALAGRHVRQSRAAVSIRNVRPPSRRVVRVARGPICSTRVRRLRTSPHSATGFPADIHGLRRNPCATPFVST